MKPIDRYRLPASAKEKQAERLRQRLANYLGEAPCGPRKRRRFGLSAVPVVLLAVLLCLAAYECFR